MPNGGPSEVKPESDIYTVMVIVATVFLAAATLFVAVRSQTLLGSWIPFF